MTPARYVRVTMFRLPFWRPTHAHLFSADPSAKRCARCTRRECASTLCTDPPFGACTVRNQSTHDHVCDASLCGLCVREAEQHCEVCALRLAVCPEHKDSVAGRQPRCCPVQTKAEVAPRCAVCCYVGASPLFCNQCCTRMCSTCATRNAALPPVHCADPTCRKALPVCTRCRASPRRAACPKGHVYCSRTCGNRQRCTVCREWACPACNDGQFVHTACERKQPPRAVKRKVASQ